ncbi:MAG: PQQ-binding-like beta-propeller repeat protein [Solirubrobacteraceae bacterium]
MLAAAHRCSLAVIALASSVLVLAGCGGASGASSASTAAAPGGPTDAGPVNGIGAGWPALLHGPSHYGTASVTGPMTAHVRWRRALEGPIVPAPVITASGVAYVASDAGVLHAITVSTGKDRWRYDGGGSYGGSDLSTAPLVLGDGRIIWPGPRHMLFGLGADGRRQWTIAGNADLLTPVLDPATQDLVVADQSGQLSGYRLPRGAGPPSRLWSLHLATTSFGNPVVAADGTIYQTAGDALFALAPDGRVRWKVPTPSSIETSPAVAQGGIVVFGSNDQREYGVDPGGHVRWRAAIGNFTYSSPLTTAGHRAIFGNHSGQMTVLDSDTGRLISRDQGAGQLWTAAAVDGRGDAYFASRTGHIFGFGVSGRRLFDLNAGSTFDSYPALAPDGTLLVGSDGGTLYAIR